MKKASGGSLLIAGIFLVILGAITQALLANLVEFLVRVLGYVMMAGGIFVGVFGLIKMFSGGKSSASDF